MALCGLSLLTGCPDPAPTPVQQAGPQLSAEELARSQSAPLKLLLVGSAERRRTWPLDRGRVR